jgi:hypothetical protein
MKLHESEDQDLDQAFAQLRAHDRRRVPDAADVLARAKAEVARAAESEPLRSPQSGDLSRKRDRGWVRWGVPGFSVALAAALAALLLVERDSEADRAFDQVLASYVETHASLRSPTDALLRLPGDELLRTVPRIGIGRPASRNPENPS